MLLPPSDLGSSAGKEMGGWECSLQHEFYLQHAEFDMPTGRSSGGVQDELMS